MLNYQRVNQRTKCAIFKFANSAPQRFGPGPTGSPARRQCSLAGCVACVGKKDVGVAKFGTYHPNGIDEYLRFFGISNYFECFFVLEFLQVIVLLIMFSGLHSSIVFMEAI